MATLQLEPVQNDADLDKPKQIRTWTTEEYYAMGAAGLFGPEERTELLDGIIYIMSPIVPPHAVCVSEIAVLLQKKFGARYFVNSQNPIHLNDRSEPQPDVFVAVGNSRKYRLQHPTADEVVIIVEVSDTSVSFDRRINALAYASANIPEFWLFNLSNATLEIHRDPTENSGYQSRQILTGADHISPLSRPDLSFAVSDMLPLARLQPSKRQSTPIN
jgi:Uma2 family endonuclease